MLFYRAAGANAVSEAAMSRQAVWAFGCAVFGGGSAGLSRILNSCRARVRLLLPAPIASVANTRLRASRRPLGGGRLPDQDLFRATDQQFNQKRSKMLANRMDANCLFQTDYAGSIPVIRSRVFPAQPGCGHSSILLMIVWPSA